MASRCRGLPGKQFERLPGYDRHPHLSQMRGASISSHRGPSTSSLGNVSHGRVLVEFSGEARSMARQWLPLQGPANGEIELGLNYHPRIGHRGQDGGGRGIRTPGSVAASAVFKISPRHFAGCVAIPRRPPWKCVGVAGWMGVDRGETPGCCTAYSLGTQIEGVNTWGRVLWCSHGDCFTRS